MSIFIGQPIYLLKDTCLKNGTLEKTVIFGVQEGVLLKKGAWKSKIESPTASILPLSPLGMPFLTFIGQQYIQMYSTSVCKLASVSTIYEEERHHY